MLTIKAEIKRDAMRVDRTYNVKMRFTLDRKVRRLSTSLFVSTTELTKSLHFKEGTIIKSQIDELTAFYQKKCAAMGVDQNHLTLDDIFYNLEADKIKQQKVDFIQFSRQWIAKSDIKGAANYTSALNSLIRFIKKDTLEINDITQKFLEGYKTFLLKEHDIRVRTLIKENKRVPSNRALSLYLVSIKRLFNEAKRQYNQYDRNIIVISGSPFDGFSIPRQEATRKRAISIDIINKIWKLPYQHIYKGYHHTCRFDLAKDCFLLSFCLIGMNSADLFNATQLDGNTLTYNRMKTKERRLDDAKMVVDVPAIIKPIIEKYRDRTGKRVFNFYQCYANEKAFNKALNKGLKEIGNQLEIEDLEFYAARHSWATIALNKVGIDKYTVHAALNHVDESMKVTDIYIERDFAAENKANEKVLNLVFSELGK